LVLTGAAPAERVTDVTGLTPRTAEAGWARRTGARGELAGVALPERRMPPESRACPGQASPHPRLPRPDCSWSPGTRGRQRCSPPRTSQAAGPRAIPD